MSSRLGPGGTGIPELPAAAARDPRRWRILAVLCLSLVIVVVANTSLNVAIPTLVRDLGASASQLQWIVDAYAIVFAGLLLLCGALGDRFGRRGALTTGLVVFGAASLAAAMVDTPGALITTRALMGVGAALIMPATLALVTTVFDAEERPRAIAIWAGFAGAGGALGPPLSGLLLERYWWGSVFLINLPLIIVALVAGALLLPRSKEATPTKLDPLGAALSVVGLSVLLLGVIEAPLHGWVSGRTLGTTTAGLAVIGAFAWWELRTDHPMLDLRFFRNRAFSAAAGSITLVFFAMFGMFFLLTQYLQLVLGYSTLAAGLSGLPMAIGMMIAAPRSAGLAVRYGAKAVVTTGLFTVGAGLLLVSRLQVDTPYAFIGAALLVMALGMGFAMAPATTWIMTSLPLDKAGVGSAVNDTTRELGGALGVAVLGSLHASLYVADMTGIAAATRSPSLGAAIARASTLTTEEAGALVAAAQSSFVEAMSTTVLAAAAVTCAAALTVAVTVPSRRGHLRRLPRAEWIRQRRRRRHVESANESTTVGWDGTAGEHASADPQNVTGLIGG